MGSSYHSYLDRGGTRGSQKVGLLSTTQPGKSKPWSPCSEDPLPPQNPQPTIMSTFNVSPRLGVPHGLVLRGRLQWAVGPGIGLPTNPRCRAGARGLVIQGSATVLDDD